MSGRGGDSRGERLAATPATDSFLRVRSIRIAVAVYLAFAATFASFEISNDGVIYYDFLRRLLGEGNPQAYAYQFGTAYWDAPFDLAVRGLRAVGFTSGGASNIGTGEVAVVLASTTAVILAMWLGWRLLGELCLPRSGSVLLFCVFGTTLFYYATFVPSYTHAADALFWTLAVLLLLIVMRYGDLRVAAALGACLALLVAIRYTNGSLVIVVLAGLVVVGHKREALVCALVGVASATVLFGLPVVRGIPYASAGTMRNVYGSPNDPPPGVGLDPLAPFQMLFTLHRGLFLWTPLTAIAAVGFVLLLRRSTYDRPFLVIVGASGLTLIASYSVWGLYWDGGYSFSQRFFTGLFPLYLIGLAELVRRSRRITLVAAGLCACFTMFIGFTHFNGHEGLGGEDGVDDIVALYVSGDYPPADVARLMISKARTRWTPGR